MKLELKIKVFLLMNAKHIYEATVVRIMHLFVNKDNVK